MPKERNKTNHQYLKSSKRVQVLGFRGREEGDRAVVTAVSPERVPWGFSPGVGVRSKSWLGLCWLCGPRKVLSLSEPQWHTYKM